METAQLVLPPFLTEYAIQYNDEFKMTSSQRAKTMHSCLKSHLGRCGYPADMVRGCSVVVGSRYAEYCCLKGALAGPREEL